MGRPLEEAYENLRAHLHGQRDDRTPEELRSVLWLCAEAVERLGWNGMTLRDLGDRLTGETMSPALRAMLDKSTTRSSPRSHPDHSD